MSIDMNKTDTVLDKVDVISHLIAQMPIMFMTHDSVEFPKAHARASDLMFELQLQLEDMLEGEEE